jgi:hypothetical protein
MDSAASSRARGACLNGMQGFGGIPQRDGHELAGGTAGQDIEAAVSLLAPRARQLLLRDRDRDINLISRGLGRDDACKYQDLQRRSHQP